MCVGKSARRWPKLMKLKTRLDYRARRHRRLRQKIHGTATRPRMSVCVSNKHMYVQFIDDVRAVTLAAVSTAGQKPLKNNLAAAKTLGQKAAAAALAQGIQQVVFDRGGHVYQGRVQAIAAAAREAGIKI